MTMHTHIAILPCCYCLHQVPPPLRPVSKLLIKNEKKLLGDGVVLHLCWCKSSVLGRSQSEQVLSSCYLYLQFPPCPAKDSAMENIHGQLLKTLRSQLTPPPLFVTVDLSLHPLPLLVWSILRAKAVTRTKIPPTTMMMMCHLVAAVVRAFICQIMM
jgi:hypothetical protein